jgi:serpin B
VPTLRSASREAPPEPPASVPPTPAKAVPEDDGFHKLLSKPEAGKPAGEVPAEVLAAAVERSNKASFALWQALAPTANFVVSPYSIRSALALVYLASLPGRGRSSLRSGLLYPERNEDMDIRLLDGAVQVSALARYESANAVWVTRKDALSPTYLDAVSRTLPAEVHSIGFATDPGRAQKVINAWVSDRTRGKIPNILRGPVITKETRVTLVNAVYFFGKWRDYFETERTAPKPFRTSQGATVQAKTMVGATCAAVFGDDYRAATKVYQGTTLVFVVVVPERWQRFRWEAAAFRRVWADLKDSRQADLELPKFTLRSRKQLPDALDKLGLRLGDPRLLSGLLASGEPTSVGLAIHEAFIQVDETSTEAAAATAIGDRLIMEREPPPVFRVDQPFYFLLVERRTGLVTFMGQVTDPTAIGG